jgi:hypothetical protein
MTNGQPPDGLWRGKFVQGTNTRDIDLFLRFDADSVMGEFNVDDPQGPSSGLLQGRLGGEGPVIGRPITITANFEDYSDARLDGFVRAIGDIWILCGAVSLGGRVGFVALFHILLRVETMMSAWDGGGVPLPGIRPPK